VRSPCLGGCPSPCEVSSESSCWECGEWGVSSVGEGEGW